MNKLITSYGELSLARMPIDRTGTLRAWDAADELLLSEVYDRFGSDLSGHVFLLVNDQFGALSTTLMQAGARCVSWSDSWIAHVATQKNIAKNGLSDDAFEALPSTAEVPARSYTAVLYKIPKNHHFAAYQLQTLQSVELEARPLLAGGMLKHLPRSLFTLFEKIFGDISTSLAKKKARLIFVRLNHQPDVSCEAFNTLKLPDYQLELSALPNVFAHEKLDIGARFFVDTLLHSDATLLPESPQHIVDLGCGNGLLGCLAQRRFPAADVSFIDESYMAVASAKINYIRHCSSIEVTKARFVVSNSFDDFKLGSQRPDLILCNPPFHQQHTVGEHIAKKMFADAARHLQADGELWIVANQHLAYKPFLHHQFKQVDVVKKNAKFVMIRCR